MPPTPALPDPADARSPAELALYMRELREASGLTYRDLEQRAEQAGEVLPRSTLATALSRDALPRPELLRAFLIACGHRDRVEAWTAARDRIAAEGGARTHTPATGNPIADRMLDPNADRISDPSVDRISDPNAEDRIMDPNADLNIAPAPAPVLVPDPGPRPAAVRSPRTSRRGTSSAPRARPARRLVPLAVGLLGLAVVALGGGHFVRAGFPVSAPADPVVAGPGTGPRPGPVEAGTYRIRAVGSGLCLGESTSRDGGGAVEQYACPTTIPVYLLEPAGGDQYTIRSLHPVLGHGCLGVDAGLRTEGARLMNDYCGRRGTAERFRIRAAAGAAAGTYRILPVHTGACVTVPGGNRTPGAAVIQLPCTQRQSGQLFAFDPVPAPTAIPDIRSN
ncbi:RICIN domain-containing protein [Streptomyces sp. NPDC047974]|uniref:RICIN domain-containing protein n=1 Tax=Streptomyces sp. NPDC047974 TaxID=3154343 RepID=UPI0033E8C028